MLFKFLLLVSDVFYERNFVLTEIIGIVCLFYKEFLILFYYTLDVSTSWDLVIETLKVSAKLNLYVVKQVSLGPLMFASKFVLVGDHYQLPPLVQVFSSVLTAV